MLTNVCEGLLRLRGLLKFFFHNLASVRKAAVSIVAQVLKLAQTTSVCGFKLLVYEAFSYKCMRP